MITLCITFDTQSFEPDAYAQIASGGVLLSAAGLLNLKWEEFSALEAAREIGLHDVQWNAVRDDTPGSLTFWIAYDTLSPELQGYLSVPPVLEYEISTGWYPASAAHGNS